jgi:hypothetical protein
MVRHVERNRVLPFFQRAPQLVVDQDLFADHVRRIKEWRTVTRFSARMRMTLGAAIA